MATKQIALGSVVKVDEDADGLNFTTVGLTASITPPPRVTAKIDTTALADTLANNEGGIEEQSAFTFEQYWHPTDTNAEIIDTLFGSKAKVRWQIIYPFATPVTDDFFGWVSDMVPGQLTSGGTIKRTITVQRTSVVTRT